MSKRAIFLKIVLVIGVLSALGNLVFLNWRVLKWKGAVTEEEPSFVSRSAPKVTPTPAIKETSLSAELVAPQIPGEETCPQACLLAIDEVKSTLTPTSSSTAAPSTNSPVKIFYLPLGSGSTKSSDWVDIPGLSSYIDPANYGKIKSIIFEASLRIPTANGRIYTRLYNKNDGRAVWFSEIFSEGAISTLIQSQPITLDTGNKLYQVQAKTTMGFESFVDFARVKFIAE